MHLAELADVRAQDAPEARCISDDAIALNNGEFARRYAALLVCWHNAASVGATWWPCC